MLVLTHATHGYGSEPAEGVTITSTFSSGPGSVRDAIERANISAGIKRIDTMLPPGTVVYVFRQLPALRAPAVQFDGGGLTLNGATCLRPDGRPGCDGLVVTRPDVVVRNLRTTRFMFDGIAVRGPEAKRVRIERCDALRNEDDGIGISAGAADVVVKDCKLENNGYRTKGKGILVFEYATAELVDNTIRYNRDGVTISRRARARLVGNTIAENYDKGLGITGAAATGTRNLIARNGLTGPGAQPAPNRDGLRVTLDSTVELEDTLILDNGDAGVVALGTSTLRLERGRIAGNGGVGLDAREKATVDLRAVVVENNTGGGIRAEEGARLIGAPR